MAARNGTVCVNCPPGRYTPKNLYTCIDCPAGTQPDPKRVKCEECPKGFYSNNQTEFECIRCYPPYYTKDHTNCTACPPGFESSDGSECHVCAPGYAWSAGRCSACRAGTECSWSHRDWYCDSCANCLPGSCSMREATNCSLCSAGRFQSNAGQTSCIGCAPGMYQDKTGSTSCVECPEGFFCPNATTAMPCPLGKFCPSGSTSPLECSSLYDPDNSGCRPSTILIVVIATSSVVGSVIVIALIYVIYMKNFRPPRTDTTPLIRRDPVYQGF